MLTHLKYSVAQAMGAVACWRFLGSKCL